MNKTQEKIENFLDEAIKKNDFILLDVLWIFSCSISSASMSSYHSNRETFKKWFNIILVRNLRKKYNLKNVEIEEKMRFFVDFLSSTPDVPSRKSFYEDAKLLREILVNKSSKILVQSIKNRVGDLLVLDKKVLSFVLNYIPIRVQDSIKDAENRRQKDTGKKSGSFIHKYGFLSDFNIEVDWRINKNNDIISFCIDLQEWTYILNLSFNEELKEQKLKTKLYNRSSKHLYFPFKEQYQEYSFWQIGDILVKIGVGYWSCSVRSSKSGEGKVSFIIPNFIYEGIKDYKNKLPIIENFAERINSIKKEEKEKEEKKKEWNLEFEETEPADGVSEGEIEESIIRNPEIVEEGLKLIRNQYPASHVGYIDILCKDNKGNFVVLELKKGKGSHEAVGKIQKYMAWVYENLSGKDKQVRGIIVVKESDKGLEYAIKGSRFPIKVEIFKEHPPTEENIKYCPKCGKPNIKISKYCSKCGEEFWMS